MTSDICLIIKQTLVSSGFTFTVQTQTPYYYKIMALNFNDYVTPDHALRMSSALSTAVEIGNEFYIPSLHHIESNVTSTEEVSIQSERTYSTMSSAEIRGISEKTCISELQSAREVIQKIDGMYDLYKEHLQLLQ
ncbi:hypothetical protein X975_00228, partial [Stegodyphus mimosarum]